MKRRAFSLVECAVSVAVLGGLVAGTIAGVGAIARTRQISAERARAYQLAWSLADEMLAMPYALTLRDATTAISATSKTGARTGFREFDHFNNYSESPPLNADGSSIAGFTGWKRSVGVQWVSATDLSTVSASDTRRQRATITVTTPSGKPAAVVKIYRARGFDSAWISPSNADPTTIARSTYAP